MITLGVIVLYENLKKLRLSLGLSQEEFGAEFGVKKTTYAGYEQGSSDPRSDFWIAVADRFKVSIDWLLGLSDDPHKAKHGGMSRLEEQYFALDATGRKLVDAVMEIESERFARIALTRSIPLFPAAAGPWEPVDGEPLDKFEVPEDSKAQFAVRVSGDSMEPELQDGEIVLCECREPKAGEIAVVMVSGCILVKQFIPGYNGQFYLRSINRERKNLDYDYIPSGSDTVVLYGTVIHKKLRLVDQ